MTLTTLLCFFLCLPALTTSSPVDVGRLNQNPVKPPPSLKVPKSSELPPSKIRKRFDRSKNTTYVTIDVPLAQPNLNQPVATENKPAVGETSISFQLEYIGASASELSAAYLTINFDGDVSRDEQLTSDSEVEVQADAYQYRYQSIERKLEQVTSAGSSTRMVPLKKASITVQILLEDLQQLAYANRLDIKLGKKQLRVRSIQLGDLRKTLISQNAN